MERLNEIAWILRKTDGVDSRTIGLELLIWVDDSFHRGSPCFPMKTALFRSPEGTDRGRRFGQTPGKHPDGFVLYQYDGNEGCFADRRRRERDKVRILTVRQRFQKTNAANGRNTERGAHAVGVPTLP